MMNDYQRQTRERRRYRLYDAIGECLAAALCIGVVALLLFTRTPY